MIFNLSFFFSFRMFISTPPTRFYIATAQSVLHLGVESFTFFSRRRWILRNIFTCTSSAPTRFFTSRQRKVYCILCFSFILFANFQMETSWVHFKCTNVYLMAPTRSPFFLHRDSAKRAIFRLFSFLLVCQKLDRADAVSTRQRTVLFFRARHDFNNNPNCATAVLF